MRARERGEGRRAKRREKAEEVDGDEFEFLRG